MFILLFSLIIPLLLIILFINFNKKNKSKVVAFVGPRGTGKTTCLYQICKNMSVKTVPTLSNYELQYNNITIREVIPNKEKDPLLKYGVIDKNVNYFCFIKNENDIFDSKDFSVKFVSLGENKGNKNVIYLENDPKKLIKFI
ncbi:hypothetical protein TUBRATIS_008890 [Tubulinosema ratisbonensis]|uniref:Signal recognition particle receptor subunit beta n=1 Tax=Tubulinosema ratisbonensis TaxID=291195 RepID=A0A437ANB3_9MICR|nr:hypothetical protein TUBRATIS_008890 [Tubulinosema ratisbonensis]